MTTSSEQTIPLAAKRKALLSGYSLSFLLVYIYFWLPALLPFTAGWSWYIPIATFVVVPLLDQLIGDYRQNPDAEASTWLATQRWMRLLPLLAVPLFLLYQGLIANRFLAASSFAERLGWLLSGGIAGATMAINVAHELIHRRSRLEQRCGGLLLASVCYGGFKIEHIYGHHVKVATPEDLTTAPRGMSLYRFWWRTLTQTPVNAFRLAATRANKRRRINEALVWMLCSMVIFALYIWLFGPWGGVYFLLQGLLAILFLETVNYIEHYGLLRERRNGRWQTILPQHSWNSAKALTNALLFNLQRHSDHHAHANRPYYLLRHFDEVPQMPFGYAAMILLALVPPLWFAAMHPQLDRLAANVENEESSR